MRFRTKTIVGVAVIELVLLAVLVGSVLSILRESNEAELVRRVQLGGKLLAAAAKDAVIGQDLATLDSLVGEAIASGQIDFVRIVDAGGAILAERGSGELLSRPFATDARIDEVTDGVFDWSAPVLAAGTRYGEVRIGVSTDPLRVLLASAQRWAAGIAGLEMVLVGLFSWLLGSYLTGQLVALRRASKRFARGDFAYRVAVRGDDELAQTAQAFNSMAQKLGDSHEALSAESLKRLQAQQGLEAALTQAQDRTAQLNAIFALSPDGFVSFDAQRRVNQANPAFLRITGLQEVEIIGLDEAQFAAQLGRLCAPGASFGVIAGLGAAAGEREDGRVGDGRRRVVELAGAGRRVVEVGVRKSEAASVSQIFYFRDVTYEVEVDRMKSEFLSHAAHELRTPMASIYGFTELLMTQEFDEPMRQDLLATIHRQTEWLVAIINELLDLARIEARRGKDFHIEAVALPQLIGEVLAARQIDPQRWPLELTCAETLPLARADAAKLRQAVSNVLGNAIKYSPAGGAIGIQCAVQECAGDSLVGIIVTDKGIGMTPEQTARVCERFWRADTSGNIPGTGLGMSIVKEIVEILGGHLEIESQPGAGTSTTLWLPAFAATSPVLGNVSLESTP